MSATMSASISSAMFADQHRAQRMPSANFFMGMAFASATTASISIIGTGVIAPVSFVALLSLIFTLVLLGLLISLILSSLTGLDRTGLVGLVGVTLSQSIAKGD